jgi:(S)-citramalyl-CoA lyase
MGNPPAFHAPLTALLFTPGNRSDRFPKALTAGADGVIVDLEDAVPAPEKAAAREGVVEYFRNHGRIGTEDFVNAIRVNPIRSEAGKADLDAIHAAKVKPDIVVLPKVESAVEVKLAANLVSNRTRLVCLIETVAGVEKVREIASASSYVVALAFGGYDLSAETGGEPTWEALLWPRSKVVHACAAAGILALDQPYIDLTNEAGLAAECARARALGFSGKLAIHPKQCVAIKTGFRPTEEQVVRARKVVAAYEAGGGQVAAIEGQMIDVPMYRSAQRILQRAGK